MTEGLSVADARLDFARERLDAIRAQDLGRRLTRVDAGPEPWVTVGGRRMLNLSSNNYLGLATHPKVTAAMAEAARWYGSGAGSSRLVAGTSPLHEAFEADLARFKGVDRALLFTSGYVANIGLVPALVGPGDVVFSDELNHASLVDACRLSRAEVRVYPHRDVAALASGLAGLPRRDDQRVLVITDSVFSMDGDRAPLEEIAALCRRWGAMLVVDEAHAMGCLGPGGRGLVAEYGLEDEVTASMSTLSKALGSFGACVTGSDVLADYLIATSRSFMFTTALPAPVVAASIAALDLLEHVPGLVERLQAKANVFGTGLREAGFNTLGSDTQIVPVLVGESARALHMAERLREEGVFAVAIRPPTVPAGMARIRFSVMATHTDEQLTTAVETVARVGRELGVTARAGGRRVARA